MSGRRRLEAAFGVRMQPSRSLRAGSVEGGGVSRSRCGRSGLTLSMPPITTRGALVSHSTSFGLSFIIR